MKTYLLENVNIRIPSWAIKTAAAVLGLVVLSHFYVATRTPAECMLDKMHGQPANMASIVAEVCGYKRP